MKNKTIKWIGIILAALVASAFLIFAYMIGDGTFKGTMQLSSNEDTAFGEKYIEYLSKYGINLDQFFSSYTHEKIRIESSLDGHNIPAERFLADGRRDNDTLILVHGMGGNRQSVYPMAELFLKNGFNALVYDQRSAGENTAEYTTFGYWESRDLSDAVRYLKQDVSDEHHIGAWGVSYGGATVGTYLGSEESNQLLSFAILESPVSSARELSEHVMSQMDFGLPVDLMLTLGGWFTRLRLGFGYDDMDVRKYVAKTELPVLLIMTQADELTTPDTVMAVYNAIPEGEKELYAVDKSEHAEVYFDHSEEYERVVMRFVRRAIEK